MRFRYRNYTHDTDEVALEISRQPEYTPTGFRKGIKETWRLRGVLHSATQSALTSALRNLESAYMIDGGDAVLLDNANNETAHKLDSSRALGGVRIVGGVNFPKGDGTEYAPGASVPGRSYEIALEAFFPDAFPGLMSFQETISTGGTTGGRFIYLQTLAGSPVRQLIAERTSMQLTQSGQAVGWSAYPNVPGPLFPSDEHQSLRRIERRGPEIFLNSLRNFTVTWNYTFESASPLGALPNAGAF